jgi:hypothetical protein
MRIARGRLTWGIALALTAALAVAAFVAARSTASSQPAPEANFPTYAAPTGPEISSSTAANDAVALSREAGEPGALSLQVGHGKLLQARALLNGETVAAAAAKQAELEGSPASTFCFGGQNASCSESEQARAKQVLLEEGRAGAYVVIVKGRRFAPPERLRRGASPVTGGVMVLIIDAHTGIRDGLEVGNVTPLPTITELQGATAYTAPEAATTAGAARRLGVSRHSEPRPRMGFIVGSLNVTGKVVVLRGTKLVARVTLRHHRFKIWIREGRYSVAGRLPSGHRCPVRRVTVLARHETHVTLTCPRP